MPSSYEREVKSFLGPKGPLARMLPRYECRPEQSEMAAASLRAMERDSVLVVEAGTGTGKTLAYLVPAIYSSRKVVISTGTKALQEQLINKDLPVLTREFDIFAAVMKGRTNYLCWKRFREFASAPYFEFAEDSRQWKRIQDWARTTEDGDRAGIKGLPDYFSAWREMSASSEQCAGQKCEYHEDCFVNRMRAIAQAADIVVVNHHLFFADLSIRDDAPMAVLPDYQTVIFDEAHGLPEVATEYFGVQVSTWRMLDLGQDLRRLQRVGRLPADSLRDMLAALDRSETMFLDLLRMVADIGAPAMGGSRFDIGSLRDRPQLVEETERTAAEIRLLAKKMAEGSKQVEALEGLSERASLLADDLSMVLAMEGDDHVYWAETRGRGVILRASPVELGPIIADKLLGEDFPVIFTSATLAVRKKKQWSFEHFLSEMGLDQSPRQREEVCLPSSYNWKDQAILYVPDYLPEPSASGYIREAAKEMLRIVRISEGRAFLLFTSYRNMELAHDLLEPHIEQPVMMQGEAPKSELLAEFRAVEESVLFATHSFWEGVDVAGKALSAVVIDKLPFASPGDPLMSARIGRIRRKGGNPFMDYQLPSAVITLKQGLGRLIRARDDRGILAVLDSRVHKKRYGSVFVESLPPVTVTTRIGEVRRFFHGEEDAGDE